MSGGGGNAKGDVLIFTHQDITLKTSSELRKFVEYIEKFDDGDIVGAAGVKPGGEGGWWNLTGGKDYIPNIREKIKEPIEAFSLDEVFFGMKKSTFEMYMYNEKVCDNWHLYAVEICLHAMKMGHKNYIVPIQIHHYSWGNADSAFHKTMKKLIRLYYKNFDMIWTTCIITPSDRKMLLPFMYKYHKFMRYSKYMEKWRKRRGFV